MNEFWWLIVVMILGFVYVIKLLSRHSDDVEEQLTQLNSSVDELVKLTKEKR
ncbi:MAG: hypothetical protein ACREA9_06150 [Pyrinomonadaceae bacterium]